MLFYILHNYIIFVRVTNKSLWSFIEFALRNLKEQNEVS